MAHKSKKKHLKHLKQHDLEQHGTAAAHPGAKADVEAKRMSKERAAAGTKVRARVERKLEKGVEKVRAAKPAGIVRKIARAAKKRITAKPKKIVKRVKKMLGRD